MTPEQLKVLFEGYGPPTESPKRPNDSQLSALFEPVGDFSIPIKKATPAKEVKRDTPIQKAKREVMTAVQKARQNMKLLEDADKLAISKIKAPKNQKYKNILHAQEEQLHHYLKQYADNYLPKSITKEYEFPKYFYYTVNGKNGIMHKRTSTDSAMFAKFMNNPEKKAMAEAQGLFRKPIKIKRTSNLPVAPPVKKKPSLDIIPFDGEDLEESMPSHAPTKKNITIQRKAKEPIYDSEEEELLSEEELRAILAAEYKRRPLISKYLEANSQKFMDLIESVGQMPPYYNKLSDVEKYEHAIMLARDFFNKFYDTRTGKLMITTPSDYKQLKLFGTRNNLIYRPSDTTKQEKDFKLESEKEFMALVLKTYPSLGTIPFVAEDLEESMPSHVPTKKNINIQRKKKPIYDSDDDDLILEALLEEAEQYAKDAKLNAKNASENVKKIKTAMAEDTDAISVLDKFYSAQGAQAPKAKLSTGKELENAYKAHNQKTFKQFTFNNPAINIGKIDKKI